MDYFGVQQIAKNTIEYIKSIIHPGMGLPEVRSICEERMLSLGADSFWYWDVGAFIFAGDETTISISGKEYATSDRMIKDNDIITIDLSPQWKDIWGDYARTIIIEDGKVVENDIDIHNQEWKNGLCMERLLHREMKEFIHVDTTFEELHLYMNELIHKNNYINLDFMGNLGHSIVKDKKDRIYIEKGNKVKLSEVSMFTFEPHISLIKSVYGYKMENIYYFDGNELLEL